MQRIFGFSLIALALTFVPRLSFAHAFGQLYNLPVPFWLYLYGAAAALLVSFFVIGYLFGKRPQTKDYPAKDITDSSFIRFFGHRYTAKFFRHAGIFFFLLTIVSGIIGQNSFALN